MLKAPAASPPTAKDPNSCSARRRMAMGIIPKGNRAINWDAIIVVSPARRNSAMYVLTPRRSGRREGLEPGWAAGCAAAPKEALVFHRN
jgi:hypothetical protein